MHTVVGRRAMRKDMYGHFTNGRFRPNLESFIPCNDI